MTISNKIVKAIENCIGKPKCSNCPWEPCEEPDCERVDMPLGLVKDVLRMIKAQEPQATTHEAEWHIFKGRRGATCSYCKYTFDDVYDPENYDYYCRHCGAKMVRIRTVKWE